MSSDASRTRSSVQRAVAWRVLETNPTSIACSGTMHAMRPTPAAAGTIPILSATISRTMPSSSGAQNSHGMCIA
eukprot:364288-Chlamydomonas_euryale.AAC.8